MEEFDPGHLDHVTVLKVNFESTRLLTASIDHRVKVWKLSKDTAQRELLETFTAHDADVRDATWFHPSTGTHLGTIGNDLTFRLWTEDPTQAPNSGRHFRRICTIYSEPRVPFVSVDVRNVRHMYTYLALIDRQGLLSIYEPTNPDDFKDWSLLDQFNVVTPPPARGEETSFKVRFDQNPTPLPYILSLSDEKSQLSLVVSAMNEVKIFRAVTTSDEEGNRVKFYEAVKLPVHPALVRDVQWNPFNVRGYDMFATACKDGTVRIYDAYLSRGFSTDEPVSAQNSRASLDRGQRNQPQSSLTTAIAGRGHTSNNSNAGVSMEKSEEKQRQYTFPYRFGIKQAANLEQAHTDAWALAWDHQGQVLMSSGSDGVTKLWKKSIQGGQWLLFADQKVELGEDGSEKGNRG